MIEGTGLTYGGPDLILTNNLIIEIPDVLSIAVCNAMIQSFHDYHHMQKHTLNKTKYGVMDFMETEVENIGMGRYFVSTMQPYVNKYLELAKLPDYVFPEQYGFESPRMKRYPPTTGRFDYHVDVGNYKSARRFLVMMVYLNDNFDGGETDFPYQGIRVKPQTGKLVMFPAGFTHPHAGLPSPNGSKMICSTYLHYT